MPGQCTKAVKDRRAHEAQELADRMHADYIKSFIGSELTVLFETEDSGICVGHSDNYILVKAPGTGLHGAVKTVRIDSSDGQDLFGSIVD